jgi:hypothetical protein
MKFAKMTLIELFIVKPTILNEIEQLNMKILVNFNSIPWKSVQGCKVSFKTVKYCSRP